MSRLVNKNVKSLDGRTSIRLEPEFWTALEEIAEHMSSTIDEIVIRIDTNRKGAARTSAVRVYILSYYQRGWSNSGGGV